jgi:hypothetical protein
MPMPVHIDEMNSETTVFDGELPLSPAQLERLIQIVLQRLDQREQGKRQHLEATRLRSQAAPRMPLEE